MIRRSSRQLRIGRESVGGNAPISVQSMAKTDTKNVAATVKQIKSLERIGCEIIRVAVKDEASARAISRIKKRISIPLEADIHFNYKLALLAIASGADAIRLNPGNIYKPKEVKEVVKACKSKKIPIRVGANSGSLRIKGRTSQAGLMVKSVTQYLKLLEREKFYDIMISLKASDVSTTIEAYRKMAKVCKYPLHLGVTATGAGTEAIVKSSIGIGTLLAEGIGDTIRVSLTALPEDEVMVGKNILQALGLRRFGPDIISCPTCGRCQVDLVKIVRQVKTKLTTNNYRLSTKHFPALAIMGCEVNGPGEAKEADIGIAFGKTGGVIFKKGKIIKKVKTKDAVKELLRQK
ncbi:MAG: flavodoxin-dependent (E)-4-hydroxy-3-methylbut-2-enyl-diphosphate synthase [Candidatus Omnitrophica bacterium]|nr:flavodoxin-dependent (E)-4-hydroxy-3-methylbut-2-enyl-diphosphate synthase [Candidatus Omnitrophota bacterium]